MPIPFQGRIKGPIQLSESNLYLPAQDLLRQSTGHIQHLLRQKPLQLGVLVFKLLQTLGLGDIDAAYLAFQL